MDLTLEIKETGKRDWDLLKSIQYNNKNVNSLRKQAKKLSLKRNIEEVTIEARGDDDPIIQEWYKDGKLSFKMF